MGIMPGPAPYIALLVALGLLLVAGASIGRARGCGPNAATQALMAALTGATVGFILLLLPVMPFLLFPAALTAGLSGAWIARRQWALLGWFLVGAGGQWVVSEGWGAWNDLADAAVSRPGWSPLPLVLASAAIVIGLGVLLASRRTRLPAG